MKTGTEPMASEGRTEQLIGSTRTSCRPGKGASTGGCREMRRHPFGKALMEHTSPVRTVDGRSHARANEERWDHDPDIWLYRKKTIGLLRRYMRWSLEAGRVPSLLGRELFRARISASSAITFEARVIFLHDMERCLGRLGDFDRQIIARAVLQEHDHESAARLLRCTRKTIERRLPGLIDQLSEAFLEAELLARLPEAKDV